ncbi:MAG: exonuclease [Comamonadaceae bacterium]|nr:MAG: exonuclease [Comamonadaceae bacterium]
MVCDAPQKSPQWYIDRLGRVTGSKASCVTAKNRAGTAEGFTRADYRMDLVLERITGTPAEPSFAETKEIAWGNEQEPMSRMAYDIRTGLDLTTSGFVYWPDLMVGTSVDAFVVDENGRRGFWESKSPKSRTHLAYLLANALPAEYTPQVIHSFWVTDCEFCDFQSFDPRMPENLRVFIKRIERAEVLDQIKTHEAAVLQFLMEVDAAEKQMRLLAP